MNRKVIIVLIIALLSISACGQDSSKNCYKNTANPETITTKTQPKEIMSDENLLKNLGNQIPTPISEMIFWS